MIRQYAATAPCPATRAARGRWRMAPVDPPCSCVLIALAVLVVGAVASCAAAAADVRWFLPRPGGVARPRADAARCGRLRRRRRARGCGAGGRGARGRGARARDARAVRGSPGPAARPARAVQQRARQGAARAAVTGPARRATWEEVEETLLASDLGVAPTQELMDRCGDPGQVGNGRRTSARRCCARSFSHSSTRPWTVPRHPHRRRPSRPSCSSSGSTARARPPPPASSPACSSRTAGAWCSVRPTPSAPPRPSSCRPGATASGPRS